ncbi:MAG TPA: MCP four helix bundle domain-containing protein [Telmatospirillum sp.]|nr:MCP four helix bundle domain-containing protein [Telmatospirillum sp.]
MTDAPKQPSRFVRRVSVCFAVMFVLVWVNGLFAATQLGRIDDESRDALDGGFATTAVLGQLSSNLAAFRALEASHLVHPKTRDRLALDAERRQLSEQLTKNIRHYESLDSSDEQKRLFMKFLTNWYAYARQSQTVFTFLENQEVAKATKAFDDNRPAFDEASATIGELIRLCIEHGRVIHEDLHASFLSSLWFLLIAATAFSLLIVGMVMAVAWHDER